MNSNEPMTNECPDEWTLSRFLENRLDEASAAGVLAHVAGCADCRKKAAALAEWLAQMQTDAANETVLPLVRKTLSRVQWRRIVASFKPKAAFLAAADGQTPDGLAEVNALRSGFIHFLSRTPLGMKDGWHVKLAIPACPTEKTRLRMEVLDGTGEPIPSGTLHFCNMPLRVINGQTSVPLADFQRNMAEAVISLCREDGVDVPGDPVLGYDLLT